MKAADSLVLVTRAADAESRVLQGSVRPRELTKERARDLLEAQVRVGRRFAFQMPLPSACLPAAVSLDGRWSLLASSPQPHPTCVWARRYGGVRDCALVGACARRRLARTRCGGRATGSGFTWRRRPGCAMTPPTPGPHGRGPQRWARRRIACGGVRGGMVRSLRTAWAGRRTQGLPVPLRVSAIKKLGGRGPLLWLSSPVGSAVAGLEGPWQASSHPPCLSTGVEQELCHRAQSCDALPAALLSHDPLRPHSRRPFKFFLRSFLPPCLPPFLPAFLPFLLSRPILRTCSPSSSLLSLSPCTR